MNYLSVFLSSVTFEDGMVVSAVLMVWLSPYASVESAMAKALQQREMEAVMMMRTRATTTKISTIQQATLRRECCKRRGANN